jgi:hypothetical protein
MACLFIFGKVPGCASVIGLMWVLGAAPNEALSPQNQLQPRIYHFLSRLQMYKEVGGYLPADPTICYYRDNDHHNGCKYKTHPPMAVATDEWILHGGFRL